MKKILYAFLILLFMVSTADAVRVKPVGKTDHGALDGLTDDDHTQYGNLSQDESVTGAWTFQVQPSMTYLTKGSALITDATGKITGTAVSSAELAHLDGQDQGMATTDSPTHVGVTLTGANTNTVAYIDSTGKVLGASDVSTDNLDMISATTSMVLENADLGVTVQAYDADTTKNDVANAFTVTQTFNDGIDINDKDIVDVRKISLATIASDADTSVNVDLGSDAGDDFTVDTSKLVVEGDTGNVGIGTASPGNALDVVDNAESDYVGRFFNDGNNANRYGIEVQAGADNGSGQTLYFYAFDGDGNSVGYIENNGGTFQLVDSSDERLKDNIRDTGIDGLDLVKKIKVSDYTEAGTDNRTGFVAQDVLEFYPKAISTFIPKRMFETVNNDNETYYGIAKAELVPVLFKAVQQLSDKVDQLQADKTALLNQNLTQQQQINDLIGRVGALENCECTPKVVEK